MNNKKKDHLFNKDKEQPAKRTLLKSPDFSFSCERLTEWIRTTLGGYEGSRACVFSTCKSVFLMMDVS